MLTVKGVLAAGVSVTGDGAQTLGGAVDPATQLRVTEFVYPLSAVIVALKVAVCPTKTVNGVFATAN
jgi:hypothetical protein